MNQIGKSLPGESAIGLWGRASISSRSLSWMLVPSAEIERRLVRVCSSCSPGLCGQLVGGGLRPAQLEG